MIIVIKNVHNLPVFQSLALVLTFCFSNLGHICVYVSIKRETFQREHVNYEKHYFIISKTHKSEGVFSPSIWFALAVINIYG